MASLLLALTGLAKPSFHRPAVEDAIRKFHLHDAQQLAWADTDSLVKVYYIPRILLIKYAATIERRYLEPFETSITKGIAIAEKLPNDTPDRGVLLAELHLLSGVMHLTRRDYFAAGKDLTKACGEVSETHSDFPDDPEHLKVLGTLEVGLSAVPKKLRWLGNLLCLHGDLPAGLAHLELNASSATLMREESEIILAYVEKSLLERGEESRERLAKLNSAHPGCYPYRYLLALAHLDARDADLALGILEREEVGFRKDSRVFNSPFWDYNRANALYYRLDLAGAKQGYEDFFTVYRGEAGYGEARFRLAMTKALAGDAAGARVLFAELASREKKGYDADAYFYQLAVRFQSRNLTDTESALFRARNLFDGGYFSRSLGELAPLGTRASVLSVEDRTELWYRQGRILQEMGEVAAAKEAYGKCLLEKPAFNLWMKVYAHFYLGQLMQQTGRPDLARQLYNAALGFDNYYYQNGLEQRCKASLAAM
jgi:hypothetical protein